MLYRNKIFLAALMLAIFAIPAAQAANYTYVFFDAPGATADTHGRGINDAGQVVGMYQQDGYYHGFILSKGIFTILNPPGTTDSAAYGINNAGLVSGSCGSKAQAILYGFTYNNGTYSAPIQVPGAAGTEVSGINNHGQMVGCYNLPGSPDNYHGFVKSGDNLTTFDFPAAVSTVPYGINNNGWIVGYYTDADGVHHGFARLPAGTFMSYDVPGATNTEIYGINDNVELQVAGTYWHSDGYRHGFVMTEGVAVTLAVRDDADTRVLGLNNLGQVVGQHKENHVFHGFIATPSPNLNFLQLLLFN